MTQQDLLFAAARIAQGSHAEHYGFGRIAPRFVTNSDVHDLKMRLNPYVVALDEVVAGCPDMPKALRDGWESFSQSWKAFFQQGEGFWTAGAEMDQAEAYQADIQTWQARLATATCTIDPQTKKALPPAALPPPPSTEGETDKAVPQTFSAVRDIVIVVALLAVGFVVVPPAISYLKTASAAVKAKSRK